MKISLEEYTILLAEDRQELRERLARLLQNKGFKIIEACNGKELEEKALSYKEDLSRLVIVSDTDMPEKCGDLACKSILERNPEFRRVIIIGMSDNKDNREYWQGIGVTFYQKHIAIDVDAPPFDLASMLESTLNTIVSDKDYLCEDGSYKRDVL